MRGSGTPNPKKRTIHGKSPDFHRRRPRRLRPASRGHAIDPHVSTTGYTGYSKRPTNASASKPNSHTLPTPQTKKANANGVATVRDTAASAPSASRPAKETSQVLVERSQAPQSGCPRPTRRQRVVHDCDGDADHAEAEHHEGEQYGVALLAVCPLHPVGVARLLKLGGVPSSHPSLGVPWVVCFLSFFFLQVSGK